MTIAIPSTGETFEAQLVADDRGVLHLLQVRPRVDYLLVAVLKMASASPATPDERARLEALGA
jgi:hypothetical protein